MEGAPQKEKKENTQRRDGRTARRHQTHRDFKERGVVR